ncbi:glycosyltransferase family 4 protein [bacterium]|nr:glycosyltransferase family 4 protein [bacterium]MCB2201935.1 glycosyltransferase family 4 protein [bacterium]
MQALIVNARFLTQPTTGVQRYGQQLSLAIKKLRPRTRFVSPPNILHREIAEQLGAEVIGTATGHVWEQVALPRFLRKCTDSDFLLCLGNTGPVRYENQVGVIHDLSVFRHPESYSRRFGLLYRSLLPRLTRTCRAIVTDSDFSKKELQAEFGIDDDRLFVVPCGVGAEFRAAIPDTSPEPYILAVSSLAPHKNLERLLRAFESLELHGVGLKILGAGANAFARTSLQTGKLRNIEFLGHVSDEELIELYRKATLFVYPSMYEGFGLPPLEAMACGCPCVVSNAASMPEVCRDAVVYCEPTDIVGIAHAILKLYRDPELQQRCRERGSEIVWSYTWEAAARKMLDIVDRVESGSGEMPLRTSSLLDSFLSK